MKSKAIILLISICSVSCNDNIVIPDSEPDKSTIMHITEPYLLEYSDWITPDSLQGNSLFYTIPDSLRDVSGTKYDFYFNYWAGTSCNGSSYVYNYTNGLYDQVSYNVDSCTGCYHAFQEFNMMVGKRYTNVYDYINSNNQIHLKHFWADTVMRVFLFTEKYEYLNIPGDGCQIWGISGIAYDGKSFWITKSMPYKEKIYKLGLDGIILQTIEAPYGSKGIAYDGENLWIQKYGMVIVLSIEGASLGEFTIPKGYYPCMTWGSGELWIMEEINYTPYLFRVDAESSLNIGAMVAIDTLFVPTPYAGGVAWDGENVIVAGDSLYVCKPTGDIIRSYRIPVKNRHRDITWDGESIWVLHNGPKSFPSSYCQIGRFRIN